MFHASEDSDRRSVALVPAQRGRDRIVRLNRQNQGGAGSGAYTKMALRNENRFSVIVRRISVVANPEGRIRSEVNLIIQQLHVTIAEDEV